MTAAEQPTARDGLVAYLQSAGVTAGHAAELADAVDPADRRTTALVVPGQPPTAGVVLGLKRLSAAPGPERVRDVQRIRVEATRPAGLGLWACVGVRLEEMGGPVDAIVTVRGNDMPEVHA